MSVLFIGCPHVGHKAIAKYRPFVKDSDDNTEQFEAQWDERVKKNDVVYVLGDAAFDYKALARFSNLRGRKILVDGNHDDMVNIRDKVEVFEEVHGMLKYKGLWLTHCPIHPAELRGKPNVHAHVHQATITKGWGPFKRPDRRYVNCSVDVVFPKTGSWFLSLDEIRKLV